MTTSAQLIRTPLVLQRFFDQTLLAKLVERGALRAEDAEEVAAETATFAHEIADEAGGPNISTPLAVSYEQIAEAFRAP